MLTSFFLASCCCSASRKRERELSRRGERTCLPNGLFSRRNPDTTKAPRRGRVGLRVESFWSSPSESKTAGASIEQRGWQDGRKGDNKYERSATRNENEKQRRERNPQKENTTRPPLSLPLGSSLPLGEPTPIPPTSTPPNHNLLHLILADNPLPPASLPSLRQPLSNDERTPLGRFRLLRCRAVRGWIREYEEPVILSKRASEERGCSCRSRRRDEGGRVKSAAFEQLKRLPETTHVVRISSIQRFRVRPSVRKSRKLWLGGKEGKERSSKVKVNFSERRTLTSPLTTTLPFPLGHPLSLSPPSHLPLLSSSSALELQPCPTRKTTPTSEFDSSFSPFRRTSLLSLSMSSFADLSMVDPLSFPSSSQEEDIRVSSSLFSHSFRAQLWAGGRKSRIVELEADSFPSPPFDFFFTGRRG
ncbi:hypothetical protein BDY24DRAFT_101198 [Mrakia frigida]|uniref:uncharacterized protein n=1 Tax=Mrakia frigida TaxID=29902 RepID=UPI003FCC1C53